MMSDAGPNLLRKLLLLAESPQPKIPTLQKKQDGDKADDNEATLADEVSRALEFRRQAQQD